MKIVKPDAPPEKALQYEETILHVFVTNEPFDADALFAEFKKTKGITKAEFFRSKGFFESDFQEVLQ